MNDKELEYISLKESFKYIRCKLKDQIDEGKIRYNLYRFFGRKNYLDEFMFIKNEQYLSKTYIKKNIKIFNESIEIVQVIKKLHLTTGGAERGIRRKIAKNFKIYKISILGGEKEFISKEDYKNILLKLKEIEDKKCINRHELLNKVNLLLPGVKFKHNPKEIFGYIKEQNLEVIDNNHIANINLTGAYLYPNETVKQVEKHLISLYKNEKIKLINITFDEYMKLNNNSLKEKYYYSEDEEFKRLYNVKLNLNKFKNILAEFKDTNVKVICMIKRGFFLSKKELKEHIEFLDNYIDPVEHLKNNNIKFAVRVARNNNIKIVIFKNKAFIKKEDLEKYKKIIEYNLSISNSKSIYSRFLIKVEYNKHKNEDKFPEFKRIFYDFVKAVNYSSTTLNLAARLFNIYNIFLDNMKKDLNNMDFEYNNRLFEKIILLNDENRNNKKSIIQFSNYLIKTKKFNLKKFVDTSEIKHLEGYEKDKFFKMLIELTDILTNENKRSKLYRNWKLATAVTYIFIQYCLAWRRVDILNKFPKPKLNLIDGVNSAEDFFSWIDSGNVMTFKIAKNICKDIEESNYRLRQTAAKNKRKLMCIIPDSMTIGVAILVCITEASRQIEIQKNKNYSNKLFNSRYTQNKEMRLIIKSEFGIDIEKILGGKFNNIRMTKGFMSLVKEKSEELGLAHGYYYSQMLRAHTSKAELLSNTTKIYLNKDISDSSIKAFATGTMGSVLYNLAKLTNNKFILKNNEDQINIIKKFNITPYGIEKISKQIIDRTYRIEKAMEEFFIKGGSKEYFLKELLYGQNSYGIEKNTKCLLKVMKNSRNNIKKIGIKSNGCSYLKSTCIGCDYLIALRYFIYELESKFNEVLDYWEDSEEQLDKEIAIETINELYIPLINDIYLVVGEEIFEMVDLKRYLKLIEDEEKNKYDSDNT